MIEAIVIIVALGGLELILWCLGHRQQKRQNELLDSIWTELAIRNSMLEEVQPGGITGESRAVSVPCSSAATGRGTYAEGHRGM